MAKTINDNPDNLDFTEEEATTIDAILVNQATITAAQSDDNIKIPSLKNFIERDREKLEKGATLRGNYIRLKYAEKFLVDRA